MHGIQIFEIPETNSGTLAVEPYKLSDFFAIIPEYDGNPVFLNSFLDTCNTAHSMSSENQKVLLVLNHQQSHLLAYELINF